MVNASIKYYIDHDQIEYIEKLINDFDNDFFSRINSMGPGIGLQSIGINDKSTEIDEKLHSIPEENDKKITIERSIFYQSSSKNFDPTLCKQR